MIYWKHEGYKEWKGVQNVQQKTSKFIQTAKRRYIQKNAHLNESQNLINESQFNEPVDNKSLTSCIFHINAGDVLCSDR